MNDIQIDIAQEKLSNWLEEQKEMDEKPPAELEYAFVIRSEQIDNRIFFVFRLKNSQENWLIGIAGGYPDEESLDCSIAFSGFNEFPEDRVIVSDPLCYLPGNDTAAPILEREIPKGSYPVEVSLYRDEQIGIRICTTRLKIKETAAVRYELAKPIPKTAVSKTKDGVICGFPIDAGLISLIDADGAEVYQELKNSHS